MLQIKRGESNATLRRILIGLVNTDGEDVAGVTLAAGELKLSKAGGAEANALGSFTECNGAGLGRGLYYYDLTVGEIDTYGELVGTIIKTGIRTYRFSAMIVADSPYSNSEFLLVEEGTAQAVTSGTLTLENGSTLRAASVPFVLFIDSATLGDKETRVITSLDVSVPTARVATISPTFGETPTGVVKYKVFAIPPLPSNGEIIAMKTVLDKLDTALALNSGNWRFTAPALALAPSGTGASAADIRAEMDASSTKLAAIEAKTTNLPAAPAGVPDVAAVSGAVGALTLTELASLPGASPTLIQGLAFLYMAVKNKRETTAATDKICNNAGAAIGTAALSDAGGLFSKAKYS